MDYSRQKESTKNPLQKWWYTVEENFSKLLKINSKNKKQEYAEKTIKELIDLRKKLLQPTSEIKSGKQYANYIKMLGQGQTESVAIKSVLTKFQKNKMLKGNFIKSFRFNSIKYLNKFHV